MIDIVWYGETGGPHERTRKNCTAMLNDMLDTYDCTHWAGFGSLPSGTDGAFVVLHGESCLDLAPQVNRDLQSLRWAVVALLGDETHSFPVEQVRHPNMKLWVQEPLPGRHNYCDRFMLDGWTPGCKRVETVRDMDWVFAGQVTHERRRACVEALRTMPSGGFIVETKGYTQGISHQEYLRCLSRAKFVPCPSGPSSPDAARAWEALECGAVPVLDATSPGSPPGFWELALGTAHPLPILADWSMLPVFLSEALPSWDGLNANCQAWWGAYKVDWMTWLRKDIECLTIK